MWIHTPVKELTEALSDPDCLVRVTAAEGLALLGPEAMGAFNELADTLGDTDFEVRMAAADALEQALQDKTALPDRTYTY